jgi:hypothetical protein
VNVGDLDDAALNDRLAEFAVATDLRHDVFQAVALLGDLRSLTRWDLETLRQQLACHPERWMQLGGAPERKPVDMARDSVAFLSLVRKAVSKVDRYEDRRRVLTGVCELSASTGGELSERVGAISAALKHPGDEYTGWDYLMLGEIDKAMRQAALNIGHGGAQERAAGAAAWIAPVADLNTHISRERLEILCSADAAEQLGPEVRQHMRTHVKQCSTCGAIYNGMLGRAQSAIADPYGTSSASHAAA